MPFSLACRVKLNTYKAILKAACNFFTCSLLYLTVISFFIKHCTIGWPIFSGLTSWPFSLLALPPPMYILCHAKLAIADDDSSLSAHQYCRLATRSIVVGGRHCWSDVTRWRHSWPDVTRWRHCWRDVRRWRHSCRDVTRWRHCWRDVRRWRHSCRDVTRWRHSCRDVRRWRHSCRDVRRWQHSCRDVFIFYIFSPPPHGLRHCSHLWKGSCSSCRATGNACEPTPRPFSTAGEPSQGTGRPRELNPGPLDPPTRTHPTELTGRLDVRRWQHSCRDVTRWRFSTGRR